MRAHRRLGSLEACRAASEAAGNGWIAGRLLLAFRDAFTAVLVAIICFYSAAAFAEHPPWPPNTCLANVPTDQNTLLFPVKLWDGALDVYREVGGVIAQDVRRPTVIRDDFPADEELAGELGGCFDAQQWVVQVIPLEDSRYTDYLLMHEFMHIFMDVGGVPSRLHHCRMVDVAMARHILRWMRMHGYLIHPNRLVREQVREIYTCPIPLN